VSLSAALDGYRDGLRRLFRADGPDVPTADAASLSEGHKIYRTLTVGVARQGLTARAIIQMYGYQGRVRVSKAMPSRAKSALHVPITTGAVDSCSSVFAVASIDSISARRYKTR